MWGGGTSRLLSLSEKKLSSLQESNTQLWLLTFCFPQTKCEGGILQRLAACKHQFRDRGLLGPYSLSLVGIVYSGMLQLCSKTTHMNTHTPQTRNLLDMALFGPRFKTGIWEPVDAAGKHPVWIVLVQP